MAERNSLKEWPRKPDGSRGSSEDRPANTSAGDLTEQRLPAGIDEGDGARGPEGVLGEAGEPDYTDGAITLTGDGSGDALPPAEDAESATLRDADAAAAEEAPPAKPGKAAKG